MNCDSVELLPSSESPGRLIDATKSWNWQLTARRVAFECESHFSDILRVNQLVVVVLYLPREAIKSLLYFLRLPSVTLAFIWLFLFRMGLLRPWINQEQFAAVSINVSRILGRRESVSNRLLRPLKHLAAHLRPRRFCQPAETIALQLSPD